VQCIKGFDDPLDTGVQVARGECAGVRDEVRNRQHFTPFHLHPHQGDGLAAKRRIRTGHVDQVAVVADGPVSPSKFTKFPEPCMLIIRLQGRSVPLLLVLSKHLNGVHAQLLGGVKGVDEAPAMERCEPSITGS
jgi:hypothetical protein